MSDKEKQNADRQTSDNKSPRPDPETLHTTDPQEHMKGPLSSLMHKVEEKAAANNEKDAVDNLEKDGLEKQNK